MDPLPAELLALQDRIRSLSPPIRRELEPIVAEALEEARFRGRVLAIAREALVRLRLDLALARFDLDLTRKEREDLRRLLEE
jgi:hypothetical protein